MYRLSIPTCPCVRSYNYIPYYTTAYAFLGPARRRSVRPLLVSAPVLSQPLSLERNSVVVVGARAPPSSPNPGQRASQPFSRGSVGRGGGCAIHRSAAHVSRSSSNRHEEAPDDQPAPLDECATNHCVRTYVRTCRSTRIFFSSHIYIARTGNKSRIPSSQHVHTHRRFGGIEDPAIKFYMAIACSPLPWNEAVCVAQSLGFYPSGVLAAGRGYQVFWQAIERPDAIRFPNSQAAQLFAAAATADQPTISRLSVTIVAGMSCGRRSPPQDY